MGVAIAVVFWEAFYFRGCSCDHRTIPAIATLYICLLSFVKSFSILHLLCQRS